MKLELDRNSLARRAALAFFLAVVLGGCVGEQVLPMEAGQQLAGEARPALLEPVSRAAVTKPLDEDVSALAIEMAARIERDQAVRAFVGDGEGTPSDYAEMARVDAENVTWLKAKIAELGWLDAGRFGREVAEGAFLIVQHSGDLELMQTSLPAIEKDFRGGRLGPGGGQDYALLFDRLQLRLGQPQRHGSQLASDAEGRLFVSELEDPAQVDARRADVGMGPLADYLKLFGGMAGENATIGGWTPAPYVVPAGGRPNVLVLFADDLRRDGVAALGEAGLRTPHMDSLVEAGLSFRKAYVAGSIHGAVCMPSRAMLMTGRHFRELPLAITSTWSVPSEERGACEVPTLFETFDVAGYETFLTGKWHNGKPMAARGLDGGGAIFFGGMSNHDKVPVFDFDPTGQYPNANREIGKRFSSELFADEAVGFLEGRPAEADPFVMVVSFTAPHDPRMAPEAWQSQYPASDVELPPNFLPAHPYPIGDLHVRDEDLAAHPRDPAEVAEHIAGYYAMIAHLDDQIGRILAALEAQGLDENTLVVLVGDNGLAVGQHGLLGKQNLYEHSSGVPLVISGPGIPAGSSSALVYIHDLFPTLCDLAGIAAPPTVTARSLAPIVAAHAARSPEPPLRATLVTSYGVGSNDPEKAGEMRGITDGRLKLIRSLFGEHDVTRLFDLTVDPWEQSDLSAEPAYSERRQALEQALGTELDRLGDPKRPGVAGWLRETAGG